MSHVEPESNNAAIFGASAADHGSNIVTTAIERTFLRENKLQVRVASWVPSCDLSLTREQAEQVKVPLTREASGQPRRADPMAGEGGMTTTTLRRFSLP